MNKFENDSENSGRGFRRNNDRKSFGGGFGRNNSRGGFRGQGFRRNFGPREMHKAVCSECSKECEVPFKPTEGKPVYCKECFMAKKDKAE